jgi:2'-5' RNA ligase
MDQAPFAGYATAMAHWEEWQQEYRFGVLLIYPPEPLRTRINSLRTLHDPRSQAICDAHISMTVPFPRPVTAEDWAALAAVGDQFAPVTVVYGPPRQYPGVPGVVLNIEPADRLSQLVTALESLPVFAHAVARRYPFSPHMTIAEFITLERTAELLQELPAAELGGTFECRTLAYAVPDEQFHFSARAFLALNGH